MFRVSLKRESVEILSKSVIFAIILYYISDYLFLRSATAEHTSYLLGLIGIEVPVDYDGSVIHLGPYLVSRNCAIIGALAIIYATILAIKADWKKKVKSMIFIFPILYIFNILRLVIAYKLMDIGYSFFWAHDLPANLSGILLGISLFYILDPFLPEFKVQFLEVFDDLEKNIRRVMG
ncbi:MAG: archaeosortase/exosortase family protein [Candidatus Methanofastidiosia archaeon]